MGSQRVQTRVSNFTIHYSLFTIFSSQVLSLLILMSFSVLFNHVSGDFLTAPPLNLPFGIQGRSSKLESCQREMGNRKASMPWSPAGLCLISVFILGTHRLGLLRSSSQTPITSILRWCWGVHPASSSVSPPQLFTRLSSFQAHSMNLNPCHLFPH